MRHLEAALRSALPDLPGGWTSIEDVAKALDARPEPAAALVIDDGHALEGTAAEARARAPRRLRAASGSRSSSPAACRPRSTCPACACPDELLELGPDDLRFRAWEVEQLFRDIYHDPVLPGDLAVLARRTEGWAAGLQLFHLATRGRSADERRRVLSGAEMSGRLLREYLAQNVLFGLPRGPARVPRRHLRAGPAVRAAVRSPARDDGQRRAARRAGAPERVHGARSRTTTDAFRYHEVLRQHLDRMLVEAIGEAEARAQAREGGRRCSRPTARSPRRCGPTAARRTGTPSGACWADRASGSRRPSRAAGSTPCRRPSSATTRGWPWPPPAGRATTAAGRRRSTATSGPRPRSVRRGPPTPRVASGSASPRGSTRSRCRRPTRSARSAPGSSASRC